VLNHPIAIEQTLVARVVQIHATFYIFKTLVY